MRAIFVLLYLSLLGIILCSNNNIFIFLQQNSLTYQCYNYRGEAAKLQAIERTEAQQAQQAAMSAIEAESKKVTIPQPSALSQMDLSQYTHRAVSFLARNFYNLKYVALVLAFCINFMLLFYKVNK